MMGYFPDVSEGPEIAMNFGPPYSIKTTSKLSLATASTLCPHFMTPSSHKELHTIAIPSPTWSA